MPSNNQDVIRHEMAIRAGLAMVERAQKAKDEGQIIDYAIFGFEDDPEVISHILIQKKK